MVGSAQREEAMPVPRPVSRHQEPVEFRPVAGLEAEFVGWQITVRSRLWDWLGTYPIIAWIVLVLLMIGAGI